MTTKHFSPSKGWNGTGLNVAPSRRVVRQDHTLDGRHILVRDDEDEMVVAFTPSQVPKLIAALQEAVGLAADRPASASPNYESRSPDGDGQLEVQQAMRLEVGEHVATTHPQSAAIPRVGIKSLTAGSEPADSHHTTSPGPSPDLRAQIENMDHQFTQRDFVDGADWLPAGEVLVPLADVLALLTPAPANRWACLPCSIKAGGYYDTRLHISHGIDEVCPLLAAPAPHKHDRTCKTGGLCWCQHQPTCDIRTSRDGWDADCTCKATPHAEEGTT